MAIAAGLWTTVVYLVVGWAGLALCDRLFRPLSRRIRAALLLIPLCTCGGSLIAGRSLGAADLAYSRAPLVGHQVEYGVEGPFNPALTDVAGVVIPWRKAVREAYVAGEWPLWNRHAGCGEPLAGSAQPAAFSLLTLLSLLVPLPQSFTLTLALVFLAAAAGAFLYAGDLGCREPAALFAAIAWTYCSYLAFWNAWPLGSTAALLPLVYAAVVRLVARPGPATTVVLAVVLSQVIVAGHPESALHVVLLGGAVGAYELLLGGSSAAPPRHRLRALSWAIASGLLALLLSALYVLPVADVVLESYQWTARAEAENQIHDTDPHHTRGALFGDLYPFVHGYPGRGTSQDKPVHLSMPSSSLYAGSVLFPLALYALWRSRRRRRWLHLGLLVFGVLAGAKTPVFFELLGRLPLLHVTLNQRLIFAGSLSLALLAGLGLDEIVRRSRRLAPGVLTAAWLVVYGLGLAWLWPRMLANGVPRELIVQHALAAVVPLAILVAAFSARRLLGWLPLLAIVLLLGQRTIEVGWIYSAVEPPAFYPTVAPLDRLPARAEPYRLVGQGFTLIPNEATLYGLEDARTYNALYHRRFRETWHLWGTPERDFWFLRISDLQRPMLSFLNVEYALVRRNLRRSPPWRRVSAGQRVKLWRNRQALPRAFVPARVRLGHDGATTLRQMARERDFSAVAWIAEATGEGEPREVENGPGEVAVRRQGSGYRLHTRLPRESWVVISETAWRGWRASSAGEELKIAYANHAFLGVRVPDGEREVELVYRPRSFEWGLAISAAGLALLAALGLMAWRTRKRPSPLATSEPAQPWS